MKNQIFSFLVGLSLALLTGRTLTAQPCVDALNNWQWRNPLPTGTGLLETAYGNGKFVSVGYGGAIFRSSNAINWSKSVSGTTEPLTSVVFANGVFVVVGYSGTILRSIDGIAWSAATSGVNQSLAKATYGNGLFVAVGGPVILYSVDGMSWSSASVEGHSDDFRSVTFGNGVFVAGGRDASPSNIGSNLMLYRSTDGLNWSRVPTTASNQVVSGIAFGNGLFVAVGGTGAIIRSSDGLTWAASNSGSREGFEQVAYGNGVFIAAGGDILRSVDGISWSLVFAASAGYGSIVSFANGLFILPHTSPYGEIHRSTDGLNWISNHPNAPTDARLSLAGVIYGANQFVAVGDGGVIRHSTDGVTWGTATSGTTADLNCIAYGNGTFLVLSRTDGTGNVTILRSEDAINWTVASSALNVHFSGVAFLNGAFIGVTLEGGIFRSVDGAGWNLAAQTSQPLMNQILTAVTFGNGVYVAVGFYGAIFSSADGINWTDRGSSVAYGVWVDPRDDSGGWSLSPPNLFAVHYANGQFVAAGQAGFVVTSVDGMTWTSQGTTLQDFTGSGSYAVGVSFLEGNFVAVGDYQIWRSPDGVNWSVSFRDYGFWRGVAVGEGSAVAVGLFGHIVQAIASAPAITSFSPDSVIAGGSGFTLTVNGSCFANGATVLWNGVPQPTSFLNDSQLTAEIAAANIAATADISVATLTVMNPGGGTTSSKAFPITSPNVTLVESTVAGPGESASVSTAPTAGDEAGISATLSNSGDAEPVTISAASYATDPSPGSAFEVAGKFMDLQVTGADPADALTANFYYPSAVTGGIETSLTLKYYNGSTWADVVSSGNVPPVKDPTDNLDGTVSGGRFTVTFDNTSTPQITELGGTFFAVAIADTTPPILTLPADIFAEARDVRGAFVFFLVSAADDGGERVALMVNPPSGSLFPIGRSIVTVSATDAHGNTAEGSFTVTVTLRDTKPPVVSCPDVTLPCSLDEFVIVNYPAPSVSDDTEPPWQITITYSPPSGSKLKAGTTTVTCTATDNSGNSAKTTFTVTREPLTFSGFLAPINGADLSGGSFASPLRTFKLGSTIPVKFTVACDGTTVAAGVHRLEAVKYTKETTADAPIDATPQDAATTGNHFVLRDGQWHFNLDTKATGLTTGIWQLIAILSDGSQHNVWIQIK